MTPFRPSTVRLPTGSGDVGYLAGLIDGEGALYNAGRTQQQRPCAWRLAVAHTNRDVTTWLGGVGGQVVTKKLSGLGHKPQWYWLVQGQLSVLEILEAVRPYLIVKREAADRAIAEITASHTLRSTG